VKVFPLWLSPKLRHSFHMNKFHLENVSLISWAILSKQAHMFGCRSTLTLCFHQSFYSTCVLTLFSQGKEEKACLSQSLQVWNWWVVSGNLWEKTELMYSRPLKCFLCCCELNEKVKWELTDTKTGLIGPLRKLWGNKVRFSLHHAVRTMRRTLFVFKWWQAWMGWWEVRVKSLFSSSCSLNSPHQLTAKDWRRNGCWGILTMAIVHTR